MFDFSVKIQMQDSIFGGLYTKYIWIFGPILAWKFKCKMFLLVIFILNISKFSR